MSTPYNIYNWYWKVADNLPGSQVYSSASGTFVPLANATYVTWLAADGGNTPTNIDTLVNLYKVFDDYNVHAVRPSYLALSISAHTTLTNPLPSLLVITPSTPGFKVSLPPMNRPGSLAKGQAVRIRNAGDGSAGSFPIKIYYNDGTTIAWNTAAGGDVVGLQDVVITSMDNTTTNGTVVGASYLSVAGGSVDAAVHVRDGLYVEGPAQADLVLKKGVGSKAAIWGTTLATLPRWEIDVGNATAETGSNAGSNFSITPYDDAGNPLQMALTILRSTNAVNIRGTNTADVGPASYSGEFMEHSVPSASKVTLTTATAAQICTLTLTAGDWDVWGVIQYDGGATTTITALQGSIHTTTAALDFSGPGRYAARVMGGITGLAFLPTLEVSATRFSVASNTAIFLNAQASFGTAACQAYGRLMARRRR